MNTKVVMKACQIAWLCQSRRGVTRYGNLCIQWNCKATVKRLARTIHSSDSGPPMAKVRAIPFTQHVKAADKTFEDFHGKGFFTARTQHSGPPEEIFLPFWIVSARVNVRLVQAQVGRTSYRSHYDASTKRNQVRQETVWAWVPEQHTWSRDYYPTEHVGLHVYASHKYRRGFVNKIRSAQSLRQAVKFICDLLDRPQYPDLNAAYRNVNRKVDPYTMYASTALRFAKTYMTSTEEYYADEMLRRVYSADQTRFVKVELDLHDVQISPVYYPAFVYTVEYLGRKLRTFVNGYDLSVGGMHIYNWNRVAAASALSMASIMTMTGGIGWGGLSGSFWIGIVLPTLVTSMLAYCYPLLALQVRDAIRRREISQAAHDSRSWDADFVRAYDAYEEQQRYHTWKTQHSERRRSQSTATDHGTVGDSRGYYQTLGVHPDATIADIQSAFRGLALKYHPDRYSDPEEKKQATAKFQKVSAAYSVLRDPKKRRAYDAGSNV